MDGVAVLVESEAALAAFRDARLLLHQAKVADTEPPVSPISALKAVEPSAGEVAAADEWWARKAVHSPKRAWLFAGPVLGIEPVVVVLLVTLDALVVEVVEVVEVLDVVSADDPAWEAVARPNAE